MVAVLGVVVVAGLLLLHLTKILSVALDDSAATFAMAIAASLSYFCAAPLIHSLVAVVTALLYFVHCCCHGWRE